jgi:uncharacterized protein with FMN-binding domain
LSSAWKTWQPVSGKRKRGAVMKKRKWLKALAVLAIFVAIAGFGLKAVLKNVESNLSKLPDLPVVDVDFSQLVDGVYMGSYQVFPVSAAVEVTVSNRTVSRIELLRHRHGQGAVAEIIPERVVEAQSLKVDAVSGATYSSIVILKAIENALVGTGE